MNCTCTAPACALLPALTAAQVVNLDVTQDNIRETICTRGWTDTVRQPKAWTDKIKRELLADFGGAPKDYELDHKMPLAVGGHPTDLNNLKLQPWEGPDGAKAKDVV